MGVQPEWITKRIEAARKTHAVSDGIATVLQTQLKGTMRERPLRTSEQATVAKALLEALDATTAAKPAR